MLALGIGVQMGQLTRLDPTPFEHANKVAPTDPDREAQSREPAVTDHLVDGVRVAVEELGSLLRTDPLSVLRHGLSVSKRGFLGGFKHRHELSHCRGKALQGLYLRQPLHALLTTEPQPLRVLQGRVIHEVVIGRDGVYAERSI